jgi:hypothetical protein
MHDMSTHNQWPYPGTAPKVMHSSLGASCGGRLCTMSAGRVDRLPQSE